MSSFSISGSSYGSQQTKKYVYTLEEGSLKDIDALSRKGANICEIHKLGISVPPAFILSTDLSVEFYKIGVKSLPGKIRSEVKNAIYQLEHSTGKMWGSGNGLAPLLLSVRTGSVVCPTSLVATDDIALESSVRNDLLENIGAPDSWCIPGAKESCHGIGLNDRVVEHLANLTSPQFAYNTYAHFLLRFGTLILGAPREKYLEVLRMFVKETGRSGAELSSEDLKSIVEEFKEIKYVPEDLFEQLEMAICECYDCWFSPEALQYRRDALDSSDDVGTAVIVQSMVFGGTGVCFTRNPFSGEEGIYGNFWSREGVKVGLDSALPLMEPTAYAGLSALAKRLEIHFADMTQFEYIVGDDGTLFVLHVATGRRTPKASLKIAVDLVREKVITPREALLRLDAKSIEFFMQPQLHPEELFRVPFAAGVAASSGVATAPVTFSADACLEMAAQGPVLLCLDTCSFQDARALRAAAGVITLDGGMVSDAAILCRGMGKPCVTGVAAPGPAQLTLNSTADGQRILRNAAGAILAEGDTATIDGGNGRLVLGVVPTVTLLDDPNFQLLLSWADEFRSMRVEACIAAPVAITPALLSHAHHVGADGFGCINTDHLYHEVDGDQKGLMLMRCILLLSTKEERAPYIAALCVRQRRELLNILRAVQGKKVALKLLDRPLEDFLSTISDSEIAAIAQHLRLPDEAVLRNLQRVRTHRVYEGCRGCKMATMCPDVLEMQVHAMMAAVLDLAVEGAMSAPVTPTIIVPNVCTSHELELAITIINRVAINVIQLFRQTMPNSPVDCMGQLYAVGAEIANPRICVRAETCAGLVSSVGFNTEELTAHMFGCSHSEAAHCFPQYIHRKIYLANPFESLDDKAVGNMMDVAVRKLRGVSSTMPCAVVEGAHTSDFRSICFFHEMGIDAISCHPSRIPIARIGAAQAAIKTAMKYKESSARLEEMLSAMMLYL